MPPAPGQPQLLSLPTLHKASPRVPAGFEFMVRPWIRYEAYDIKVGLSGLAA